MSNVSITNVETVNGNVITTLFDPFIDTITLRLVFNVSQQLATMQNAVATINWQLIELRTNSVVFNATDVNLKLSGTGPLAYRHIGTADGLGLPSATDRDIFGFRGAVEFSANDGAQGFVAIPDAFAVSSVTWFRLMGLAAV